MIRRLSRVGASAAVSALLLVAIAPPASAETERVAQDDVAPETGATGFDRCPPGYLCLFVEPDGDGPFVAFRFPAADLRRPINGLVFDNQFSAAWNRTGQVTWWLYPEPYFSGTPIQAVPLDFRGKLPFPNLVSSVNHSG